MSVYYVKHEHLQSHEFLHTSAPPTHTHTYAYTHTLSHKTGANLEPSDHQQTSIWHTHCRDSLPYRTHHSDSIIDKRFSEHNDIKALGDVCIVEDGQHRHWIDGRH